MSEKLERIAEETGSKKVSVIGYSGNAKDYSTFAEMYLENPIVPQAEITPTMCTWRGVPTIDDW